MGIIKDYAVNECNKILREPQGLLKYKFIVPGASYSYQLWDWDSWFTGIALEQFYTNNCFEYQKGSVLNFLDNIDDLGRIPIAIMPDTTFPVYSNGIDVNVHKPCLAQHVAFIVKHYNDYLWLKPKFDNLMKYLDFYIDNCKHSTGLYFWIDDFAIGVDNDPCTFFRPKKSSGSIFLNCLMYKELQSVVYLGKKIGVSTEKYQKEAELLYKAIRQNCYSEKDGFYYSVDFNLLPIDNKCYLHSGTPRHWDCLIQRIDCWSGFLAMWAGIATPEEADRMVKENLLDEKGFWSNYGVRSLSKYEKMYSIKASGNPSCWLGPIWGISNYLIFKGLIRYGYTNEAQILAKRIVKLFSDDIIKCGEMHEYYDPESGVPIMNQGFQSWNLLAVIMEDWLEGKSIVEEF